MNTQPTIPLLPEYIEAKQFEINARRAAAKANMTPTEVARLTVIEECSDKLEASGVPFMLWAANEDGKEGDGYRSWWCFHRLSPTSKENVEAYTDRCYEAWKSLLPHMLNHLTTYANATIVVYDGRTGNPASVHNRGECKMIPPPAPDLPTS